MSALTVPMVALAAGWGMVAGTAAGATGRTRLAVPCAALGAVHGLAVARPATAPLAFAGWTAVGLGLPDGRLRGTARRVVAGAAVAAGAAAMLWPGRHGNQPWAGVAAAAVALLVAAGLVSRHARAGERDRGLLDWTAAGMVLAATTACAAAVSAALLRWPAHPQPVALWAALAVPLGVAVGLPGRTAPAGRRALQEALVTAGLVALVAAVYLTALLALGRAPTEADRDLLARSLLAGLVVAVGALPARARLVELCGRALRAGAPSPAAVLATFATRMTRALPMDEVLLQLTESLRATMGPAGAEIWVGQDGTLSRSVSVPERPPARLTLGERAWTAARGTRVVGNSWLAMWAPRLLAEARAGPDTPTEIMRVAPATHLGAVLGLLVVRRPAGGRPFSEEDDRVLTELARQVGLALHNVNLDSALQVSLRELRASNAELVASRARVVAAGDASRRRIERDLHDGAQQHLVAVAAKLGLVRQFLTGAPERAATLLDDARAEVRVTAEGLRTLAHGIYPPVLRDRGLAEALRMVAADSTLPCRIEVAQDVRYPEPVETAVYFCCLEAVHNAGKHAGPTAQVRVRITSGDGELRFAVCDDGAGFRPGGPAGSAEQGAGLAGREARPGGQGTGLAGQGAGLAGQGLVNMADRLGAIGGRLDIDTAPGRGTTVRGYLPIPPAPAGRPARAPAAEPTSAPIPVADLPPPAPTSANDPTGAALIPTTAPTSASDLTATSAATSTPAAGPTSTHATTSAAEPTSAHATTSASDLTRAALTSAADPAPAAAPRTSVAPAMPPEPRRSPPGTPGRP
jgi:signal transduction histidine kinase